MFKNKIFLFSTGVLVVLAIMHFVGIKYELYFHFEKYDIPMHLLGGLWIALTAFWLIPHLIKDCSIKNYRIKSLIISLISVFILASVWEIFELVAGITSTADKIYLEDTIGDYVSAFIGLVFGFIYFINQKRSAGAVCELVMPTSLRKEDLNETYQ